LGEVGCEGLSANVIQLAVAAELPPCNYDTSGMGVGIDVNEADERHPVDLDSDDSDSVLVTDCIELRPVSELGLGFFRSRLVEHFDILFKQNQIQWPTRRGQQPNIHYL